MRRFTITLIAVAMLAAPALADRIENPIAVFAGLDKIAGTTTAFEIEIGKRKKFGALIVEPKVCYSRPVTEEPKTTSFVVVDEEPVGGEPQVIFSGWMFAESPGLSAVEHPIYDVWLTGCRDPNAPPPVVETAPDLSTLQDQIGEGEPQD